MDVENLVKHFWAGLMTEDYQDIVDEILASGYESGAITTPFDITTESIQDKLQEWPNVPSDSLSIRLLLAKSPVFTKDYGLAVHVKVEGIFDTSYMEVNMNQVSNLSGLFGERYIWT